MAWVNLCRSNVIVFRTIFVPVLRAISKGRESVSSSFGYAFQYKRVEDNSAQFVCGNK